MPLFFVLVDEGRLACVVVFHDEFELGFNFLLICGLEEEVHVGFALTANNTQELAIEAGLLREGQVLLFVLKADTDRALTLLFIFVGEVRTSFVFVLHKLDEADNSFSLVIYFVLCESWRFIASNLLRGVPAFNHNSLLQLRVVELLHSVPGTVEQISFLPCPEVLGIRVPIDEFEIFTRWPIKFSPALELEQPEFIILPIVINQV